MKKHTPRMNSKKKSKIRYWINLTKRYLILSDSFTDEDVEYSEDAAEEADETEEVNEEEEEIETLPENVTERYSSLSLRLTRSLYHPLNFFQ